MRKLRANIDKWGPGVVAVITLMAVTGLAWIYDARLNRQAGRIESMDNEITRYRSDLDHSWQVIETYRLEVQALRVEIARAGITVKTPASQPHIQTRKEN